MNHQLYNAMAKHLNNAMHDNGKYVLQVLADKYKVGTFCAEYIVLKRITFILLSAFVNTVRTKAEIRNRYNQNHTWSRTTYGKVT